MEAPDVAAFVVTLDGVIAGWGDAVASLLGYRAEEVIGRDVSMFLPGEHPSHFPRILAAAARGQRIETFETMVGRDGIRLEVALRAVPTRNGGGQVTGARATLRDVTPERAEEAQAWLTALLESSHDGIYALDTRGVIRNWSPGAEQRRCHGRAGHGGGVHGVAQHLARVAAGAAGEEVLGVDQPAHRLEERSEHLSALGADVTHHLELLVDHHEELEDLLLVVQEVEQRGRTSPSPGIRKVPLIGFIRTSPPCTETCRSGLAPIR